MSIRNMYNSFNIQLDPYWDKVVSLLHFEGTVVYDSIVDTKGNSWGKNGDLQLSTDNKKFARQIIKQGVTQEYIKQFLLKYNPADPVLENVGQAFGAEINQLADSVLTESSASAETFDLMAGVVAGDDSKAVEL